MVHLSHSIMNKMANKESSTANIILSMDHQLLIRSKVQIMWVNNTSLTKES
jgi:hypothetical protein